MKLIKLLKRINVKYFIIGGVCIILLFFGIVLNASASSNIEYISSSSDNVLVSVQGEVRYPGTYKVSGRDRVADAIRKAGGVTFLGNENKVNLADKVIDGMIITVPKYTEDGFVNLNKCKEKDFEQFKYLGLTDTSIKAIVDYSKKYGFTRKEELTEKLGIKDNVYNKIKEYIIL